MYTRYVRRRKFDHVRNSTGLITWLTKQAARLGLTAKEVFQELMVKNSMSFKEVQSLPTATVPAVSTVTVAGTAKVGTVLTATAVVTGSPVPTVAYQWLKAGANIAGATARTYTPVAGDVGAVLACKATATNKKGSANKTSAATAAVVA